MTNRIPFLAIAIFALMLGVGILSASADDNSAWMKNIDDKTYVSQLSIPGSHDAGTGHGLNNVYAIISGDQYARTQDKTLTEQWNSGIRAFDLRPSVDEGRLRIYHGLVSTNLYLDEAFSTLCGLLDQHPTETCIVIMRHENDHDNGDENWKTLMNSLLNSEPVQSHAVNFDPAAKVGDVRGKIIILCRDAYGTTPVGGFVTGWGFDANFNNQKGGKIKGRGSEGPLYVQDYYDMSASGAPATKSSSIQRMLQFSCSENTNTNLWVINHTSGYSKTQSIANYNLATSDGYRDNAATQNPVVINYLSNHTGPTGVVLMDFSGEDVSSGYNVMGQTLTDALIANNFKESPNADYFRALDAIEDGGKYYVTTICNDKKYYLMPTGYLTNLERQAGRFTFSRVNGDAYYYGFQLKDAYFTNPPVGGNPTLKNGHIATDATSHRNNWEAQVFLLNGEGKYAVRATNAAGGTSGWAVNAETYWTVTSGSRPKAEYSKTPSYVWQLEIPESANTVSDNLSFEEASRENRIYDLSGRQVQPSPSKKGIYISGRRKLAVR
ncbi:MAG: hypothetical protein J6W75_03425 [Bacteroidaceae bacterium]|nr:hypothetical protein [Bacteroidaceae bacterium]